VVEGKEWNDDVRQSHDMEATRGKGPTRIGDVGNTLDSVCCSWFLVSEAAALAGLVLVGSKFGECSGLHACAWLPFRCMAFLLLPG
jgi:hypothetical protein